MEANQPYSDDPRYYVDDSCKYYVDEDCRYYKAEPENPFERGTDEALAWQIESDYCYQICLMDSGHMLDWAMDEAERAGVEVEEGDSMSFCGKAFLYYIYIRRHEGATLTDFECWYYKMYR